MCTSVSIVDYATIIKLDVIRCETDANWFLENFDSERFDMKWLQLILPVSIWIFGLEFSGIDCSPYEYWTKCHYKIRLSYELCKYTHPAWQTCIKKCAQNLELSSLPYISLVCLLNLPFCPKTSWLGKLMECKLSWRSLMSNWSNSPTLDNIYGNKKHRQQIDTNGLVYSK